MAMSQLRKSRAFQEERVGLKIERRMGSTRTVCALKFLRYNVMLGLLRENLERSGLILLKTFKLRNLELIILADLNYQWHPIRSKVQTELCLSITECWIKRPVRRLKGWTRDSHEKGLKIRAVVYVQLSLGKCEEG